MNDETIRLTIQVLASAAVIYAVIWWVFRMPGPAVTNSAAAPVLAFCSVWVGLLSVVVGAWLWFTAKEDIWVPVHVVIWSLAITLAAFSLWIYRHTPAQQMTEPIQLQRAQARTGLILGLIAVVIWYIFVISHKQPLTPIGQ